MRYDDTYASYNHQRYAHFRNKSSGQYKLEDFKSSKSGSRMQPILQRVEVSFDEVKNLNLDSYGSVAPTLDTEDFTIISNYLVDFWGAIMGNCPVDAYMHLKRHAYGKKDYCYIDIGLIALKMKRSKNTVKGYLDTLEEYGFIATFHRIDKEDNNKDVSPLFKIRRYVPLITEEMYNGLDPKLKYLHDSFMKSFEDVNFAKQTYDTDTLIKGILSSGRVINSKSVQKKIDKSIKEGTTRNFILDTLTEKQESDNELIHIDISETVSKPTYETWIRNTIVFKHEDMVIVLSPNEEVSSFMEYKYTDYLTNFFVCESVVFNSHEEYIENHNRASI